MRSTVLLNEKISLEPEFNYELRKGMLYPAQSFLRLSIMLTTWIGGRIKWSSRDGIVNILVFENEARCKRIW